MCVCGGVSIDLLIVASSQLTVSGWLTDSFRVVRPMTSADRYYLMYQRPLQLIVWCHHHHHLQFHATLKSYIWGVCECNFLAVWSGIPPIGAFNSIFFECAIFCRDTGKILPRFYGILTAVYYFSQALVYNACTLLRYICVSQRDPFYKHLLLVQEPV